MTPSTARRRNQSGVGGFGMLRVHRRARIRRGEEITHECRDEVRGLLEAFARIREANAERLGKKSSTPERE